MKMKRRTFLQAGLMMSASGLLSSCNDSSSDAPLIPLRGQPLYVPPLETGTVDAQGVRRFNLNITTGSHRLFQGLTTRTWCYTSATATPTYLGPTLKLTNGERVAITYTNNLNITTTVHGHGMHVPGAADGGPHQPITPGNQWTAQYTVKQAACTAWYHPHQMGKTAEQVYHGLAGLIIVEDATSRALGLPSQYGVDDIPLVLQDRRFDTAGQILYAPSTREIMQGYRGATWLTNGQIQPVAKVPSGWVRLRILNGSNAGVYQLHLSNPAVPVKLIATDGGFLQTPVDITTSGITLSPAERAELLVDLSALAAGSTVTLQGKEAISGTTGTWMTLQVGNTSGVGTLPATLATYQPYQAASAVTTRTFNLSMLGPGQLGINGKAMSLTRIDKQIPINQLEIWQVTNNMRMPHNFHVHGAHFMPLDRNNSANNLKPWEKNAWKDTLYVGPNETVRFLIKMTDYTTATAAAAGTDTTAPYMFHCHFLEHEDAGMMGQFNVF